MVNLLKRYKSTNKATETFSKHHSFSMSLSIVKHGKKIEIRSITHQPGLLCAGRLGLGSLRDRSAARWCYPWDTGRRWSSTGTAWPAPAQSRRSCCGTSSTLGRTWSTGTPRSPANRKHADCNQNKQKNNRMLIWEQFVNMPIFRSSARLC